MCARTISSFDVPTRTSMSHIPPPSRHQLAALTGGLHSVFSHDTNQTKSHEPGQYTSNDGSFAPEPGMPLLACRYKVLDVIGKGQSSIVLKAQDTCQSDTFVSLKVLHSHYNLIGSQETDFIRQLNQADPDCCSSTLRLITTFQFDGHYCLVFELLHPAPLVDVVRLAGMKKNMNGDNVGNLTIIRQLTRQLLKAMGFLRQQNVIHADLKPANLLLADASDFNTVKIVDFGNAIHCVHDELSLYYNDFELQTLLYRAPEVIFGVPFGLEVDMWSLGCILAELYMQKRLFTGKDKTEVLKQMSDLLGSFPHGVFQRGKFYSLLTRYCTKEPQVDATQALMAKMGCNDYAFASFIASCLRYNPTSKAPPTKKGRHSIETATPSVSKSSNRPSRRSLPSQKAAGDKPARPNKRKAEEQPEDAPSSKKSASTSSRRANDVMKTCEELLTEIIEKDEAWPFLTPVSKRDAPDYGDIVKTPMDLGTVRAKTNKFEYLTPGDMLRDIRLTFTNCIQYNMPQTAEYKAVQKLQRFFDKRCKELKLESCLKTPTKGSPAKKQNSPSATNGTSGASPKAAAASGGSRSRSTSASRPGSSAASNSRSRSGRRQ